MKFAPYKKDVIYWLVIISLLGCLYLATNKCTTYKETNTNNIEAFTDSITTYKSKNGELVASKTMIEGKFNDLKKINSELYEKIKAMSIGGEPDHIVYTNNTIVNVFTINLLYSIFHNKYSNIVLVGVQEVYGKSRRFQNEKFDKRMKYM